MSEKVRVENFHGKQGEAEVAKAENRRELLFKVSNHFQRRRQNSNISLKKKKEEVKWCGAVLSGGKG